MGETGVVEGLAEEALVIEPAGLAVAFLAVCGEVPHGGLLGHRVDAD
jgi:hypothetical protein